MHVEFYVLWFGLVYNGHYLIDTSFWLHVLIVSLFLI